MLFHAGAGKWESVARMRAVLPNLEWLMHLAFLKRRNTAAAKAAAKLQRQTGKGRR